jgi:hypothetical protein
VGGKKTLMLNFLILQLLLINIFATSCLYAQDENKIGIVPKKAIKKSAK